MNTLRAVLVSMRPRQWVKNGLVFTGLIFAGRLGDTEAVVRSIAAFGVFCALSGAVYLLNDVRDREQDRRHAEKRRRPVASGALPVGKALTGVAVLSVAGLGSAFALSVPFMLVAAGFLLLHGVYVLWLKNVVVVDILVIAAGFVLRALAGMVAISASVSLWLLSCAALLAAFLALAKRRHELLLLRDSAGEHRSVLDRYSTRFMDLGLWVLTGATIVAYSAYALFSSTSQRHGYLLLTVPFVVFGLFRYRYLVYRKDLGGSPEEVLLTDLPLAVAIALWLAVAILAILV